MHVHLLSHVQLFLTVWTVACQPPLYMEFSRKEYWSGLPFPSVRDLPDPGVAPASPAFPALTDGFFTTEPPKKPHCNTNHYRGKYSRGLTRIHTKIYSYDHSENDNFPTGWENQRLLYQKDAHVFEFTCLIFLNLKYNTQPMRKRLLLIQYVVTKKNCIKHLHLKII